MTRDEILSMEPGRELDARIAHLVMGWHITSCETYPHEKIVRVKTLRSPEESGGEVPYEKTFTKVYSSAIWNKDIPHYSTENAAALEVATHLQKQGYYVCIELKACEETSVGVYEENPAEQIAYAKAQTPAEAICKAALLAVMGEWR